MSLMTAKKSGEVFLSLMQAPAKRTLTAIVLLLATSMFSGCAVVHHYSPYIGTVVDADTGEPIEGAVVLAVYSTQSYSVGGPVGHYLDAQEVMTDKNGKFRIPTLTSFTFRPLQTFRPWAWMWIYKPGYGGYGCDNWHEKVEPKEWPIPPQKHETFKLPKLETKEERAKYYGCYPTPYVPKEDYPNLQRAIQQESSYLGYEP